MLTFSNGRLVFVLAENTATELLSPHSPRMAIVATLSRDPTMGTLISTKTQERRRTWCLMSFLLIGTKT